ncbi:uncharacterized protein LOC124354217 isoform X1 [Homalodisca vitripennis]|uniref:uncharacterized protein LOC124354217 isoform X1 n=1 Tax=Homalodisca vitripennis TaxID=197043 RepID=UPI001EECDFCB|nr:uncharacterized protein LOC124354217 isoform X1 [Homalodisca vitripennis]
MNELEACFSEYFIYFGEVMNYWSSQSNKISEILRPISNQTEQLRLCSRAQLDDGFLKKFPDVKQKLLGKIHSNIEEELVALDKLQKTSSSWSVKKSIREPTSRSGFGSDEFNRPHTCCCNTPSWNLNSSLVVTFRTSRKEIKALVDGLKFRLTSVEKAYAKHNPDEDKEFNPLNPGNGSLLEYAGDSWGCFHILWLGVKTAIETIDYFEKESITNISDAFSKYKLVQTHLQDILDLTYYLRTT